MRTFARAVVVVMGLAGLAGAGQAAPRPNILLILVDDMGYSDLGCYGSEIRTPNLDALAAGGTRWRTFYNAAQCCPTRASLMTGLYPHQAGVGDMIDDHSKSTRQAANSPAYSDRLAPAAPTIAEALQPAGYQSFTVGKWHLGYHDGQRPLQRGFDRYYGIIAGADSFFKPKSLREDDAPVEKVPADFYATDAFTDKAIQYLEKRDPKKPFFLYVAYNAPHAPFHALPADIERYKETYHVGWDVIRERRFARQKELGLWPKDAKLPPRDPSSVAWTGTAEQKKLADRMGLYAAMIDNIDQNVGKLTAALARLKLDENTLILFLSDNGAWAAPATYGREWAEACNTPFRLYKVFVHEGGICTPLIARWPHVIPAGKINTRAYGHVKDLLPTFLDLAGASLPTTHNHLPTTPLAGRSLVPMLKDPDLATAEPIHWERRGHEAMRDGRWKIVRHYSAPGKDLWQNSLGPRTGRWELYDLAADPFEANDLAPTDPQRLADMIRRHEAWAQSVGVILREKIVEMIEAAEKKK